MVWKIHQSYDRFGGFTKVMIGLDFKQNQGDHTLFIKHSKRGERSNSFIDVCG